jgi:stage V sporulation protein B
VPLRDAEEHTIKAEPTEQNEGPSESGAMPFETVARQATVRFAGLAIDKALGFAFALFAAKTYGSTAFGLYVFGVGVFEVAYALTELGLERAAIRGIANAQARGRPEDARAVVRTTLRLMLPLGIAVGVAIALLAKPVAGALGRADLAPFLQLAAVAVPASLVADGYLWATEGLGTQRYIVAVRMIFEPIVKIAIAAALFVPFGDTTEAEPLAIAYAAAVVASAAVSYAVYRAVVARRTRGGGAGHASARELLAIGLPACGLRLLLRLLAWWDIFLIFTFVSIVATTHYTVAVRTATLTAMIASAFDAAFRPRIAGALAVGDHAAVEHEYLRVSRTVLMLCLPACVMLIAFPHVVMPVLGDQFAGAASVVAVVAAGSLVSFVVGPATTALTMAGQSRRPFVNGLVGGAAGVLLGLALVPRFGVLGVAVGQFASLGISNALHAIAARREIGVLGFGRDHLRLALAAAASAGAGLAVLAAGIENKYAAFVAVGTAVVVAYAAGLVAARVPREDWALLAGALRQLRR